MFYAFVTRNASQRVCHIDYKLFRLAVMLAVTVALVFASQWLGDARATLFGKLTIVTSWPVVL
jgi:hypothetical protein